MIKYDRLFALLKSKNMSIYKLKTDKIIGTATIDKIRKNEGDISTKSINSLCKYLNCQPSDLIEYIEDKEDK